MQTVILASASPRRREILEWAGVPFTVMVADVREEIHGEDPEAIVKELSRQKAEAVLPVLDKQTAGNSPADFDSDLIVIGADTVVAYEGRILGKPADEEEAYQTLCFLQGQTHQVYTGVTVFYRKLGFTQGCAAWNMLNFVEKTDVAFYPVSPEEIRAYVATKEALDKAGSYGIQGRWGIYVRGIHGDYQNVVGLPVARLLQETARAGLLLRR